MQRTAEVLSEQYKGAHEKPIDHVAYLSVQALSQRFWDIEHRMDCLNSLTFQDFTRFVANFFSKVGSTKLLHSPLSLYFVGPFKGLICCWHAQGKSSGT